MYSSSPVSSDWSALSAITVEGFITTSAPRSRSSSSLTGSEARTTT